MAAKKATEQWEKVADELILLDEDDLKLLKGHRIKNLAYFLRAKDISVLDELGLPKGMHNDLAHFLKYAIGHQVTEDDLFNMTRKAYANIHIDIIDKKYETIIQRRKLGHLYPPPAEIFPERIETRQRKKKEKRRKGKAKIEQSKYEFGNGMENEHFENRKYLKDKSYWKEEGKEEESLWKYGMSMKKMTPDYRRFHISFSFKNIPQVSRIRDFFDEGGYLTWIYEGNKTHSHIMTACLIISFLFCACFSIWPNFLKVFVWYSSITMLIFLFFLITFRDLIFLMVWMFLGYNFWLLPNLFDDKLGFVASFKPFYVFEATKSGQLPYRIVTALFFCSFCWYATTQQSKFDNFIKINKDFITDLINHRVLPERSQESEIPFSSTPPHDPIDAQSLDELLKSLGEDEDDETEPFSEEEFDKLLDNLVDNEVNNNEYSNVIGSM